MKIKHKNKILLSNPKHCKSIFELSRGLMFANKEKIEKGAFFTLPGKRLSPRMSAVTMLFVVHPLDILFLNEEYKVVDKVSLKAWIPSYIPKAPAKYIVESSKNSFKDVQLGDELKIEY
jgi:uncharacterized membrane protein (UPF0127 family)